MTAIKNIYMVRETVVNQKQTKTHLKSDKEFKLFNSQTLKSLHTLWINIMFLNLLIFLDVYKFILTQYHQSFSVILTQISFGVNICKSRG